MGLNRDQILAADDLPREKVAVPEWGGDVWVRTLTAGQRERWESLMETTGKGHFMATVVALTACDEQGSLLFTEADIPTLAEKSPIAVMRISDVATRLAKITAADIDRLEKNSDASPSDSSATGSPPS